MSHAGSQKVDIVGIGESEYAKRGHTDRPEFLLACDAIRNAAADSGIDVREIDGFASFARDRNDAFRIASALGVREVNFSNMVWGGGGGGCVAAIGNAASAIVSGTARYVVVYRAIAQGQFGRLGQTGYADGGPAYPELFPYGLVTPAHGVALNTRRFMDIHRISQDPLASVALASYAHAQRNPRAVMYGHPLTREMYDNSRWIAEPFHLYDCCQESDGAAAVILAAHDRAADSPHPVCVLAAAQGGDPRHLAADDSYEGFATANFSQVARRLWERSGLLPGDVDVVQAYENFTGGVVMSLVDHGFCAPDEVEEFMTTERFAWDGGGLPLNTSGGNLAEAYIHGLELVNEAVRQIRGDSTSQVADARTALVIGGPRDAPVSNLLITAA